MKNVLLALLLYVTNAQSALIVVNSNQDAITNDGNCTLREALTAANFNVSIDLCSAGSGDDLIWLLLNANNESIQLDSILPIIGGVEIQGPGADSLVLFPANGNNDHIFQVNTDRDVSIKDFRIGGANSSAIDVVNVDGLLIEDMRFLNNTADSGNNYGGAIHADAQDGTTESINSLVIESSFFQGNSAEYGGAVSAGGSYEFIVNNSVFNQNTSTATGAAIYRYYRSNGNIEDIITSVNNSQFIANEGAGTISLLQQTLDINESLFQNNAGTATISALNARGTVQNSIFADRSQGNSIFITGIPSALASIVNVEFNTFINQSNAVDVLVGTIAEAMITGNAFAGSNPVSCQVINNFSLISNGYNLEAAGSSCALNNTDIANTDAELMPLNQYDGDVIIAPPFPLSPLVDAGLGCNNNDISGEGRSKDGDADGQNRCDIGAVERPNAHNLFVGFDGNGAGEINLIDFALTCQSSSDCIWPLPQNETFSLSVSPEIGSTFIQWGLACSGDTFCDITMDNFKFLSAEFASLSTPVTLTVNKDLEVPGLIATVSSSPAGINCGDFCGADFMESDVIELNAFIGEDTVIDTWTGCDVISNGVGTCTVTMGTENRAVTLLLMQDPDIIFKSGFDN